MTLRFRLMLWNMMIVLTTALLVLLGLRESVRHALIRELDAILVEDLQEVRLGLTAADTPLDPQLLRELDRKAAGHQAHRWFTRFLDPDGKIVWVSFNEPILASWVDGPEEVPHGSGRYRLVQSRLLRPRAGISTIQVGASIDLLEADVRRIDRLVAVTVVVILIVAPLLGYWLAGRALGPVANIIETASRLRPDRLDERLPDRRTGDELDKLAATVNRLLDRTAVYLGERRDFLANSAHELRSPLAAMQSTVEVALQSGRLAPEDEEALSIVIDECRSLEYLVNQLLLLAETEAEQLIDHTRPVSFDLLLASAVNMFSAAAELKSVSIETNDFPEVFVRGNPNHLRQIINNLLDNAVKFSPDGGTVVISLKIDAARKVTVLQVDNTGKGISSEDLPRVFDRFFRADRSRRRNGHGTGLGLSICQAMVAAHQGTISAENRVGEKTRFTVILPLVEPPQSPNFSEARVTGDL